MPWADRSLPPERDDDPPQQMPAPLDAREAERLALIAQVRRGVHSKRQRQLVQQIAALTLAILKGTGR
ncbi:hypothetical protein [Rhodopseudomonas sp. AAP120]|uniref:hypothetical protein n=1 Tax=Rhodopseudomonas sp. AAP120 TaxID=1523430 RepID=UPI000AC13F96|nr:hypothetical protein [Rhodopseudomonas sp. AAP120]